MNLDSFSLECFLQVAKSESFTKAAQNLGRSQSAISQQISKLEGAFNKFFFERKKKLKLTPDGELFLQYAKQIYSMQKELFDRFNEPTLEGEIKFGLPEDFASVYLDDVLAKFHKTHPKVLLRIECDLSLNLMKRFEAKEFDLALIKLETSSSLPTCEKIFTQKLVWVGDSSLLEEAEEIPLVLAPSPCIYRQSALKALENKKLSWRLSFTSPSFASAIAAVKAGMGITALPSDMVPKDLKIITSHRLPRVKNTQVAILAREKLTPAMSSFKAFILKKLKV